MEHSGSNSQWIWKQRDCSRSPALTFKSQAVRVLKPQTIPNYPYEPKVGLTFMAVSVTCRNLSGEMLQLLTNPIQMIDPFQSLVNEIPIPQELIQFYGGRFAASANVHGVVEDFRAPHRAAYHSQLYRQRFSSVPLPVGVSTSWTQYYPYSPHKAGPIKVILLGHGHIRDTVPFVRVPEPPRLIPPPSNPPTPEIPAEVLVIGIALGIVGAISLLNQVN